MQVVEEIRQREKGSGNFWIVPVLLLLPLHLVVCVHCALVGCLSLFAFMSLLCMRSGSALGDMRISSTSIGS
uniref:Uncharacterized protein n=2 Tax=Physcomitrium patens TaxID=3218 RepID=A0A2K1JUD7_PHYPA|nr:hypothetical protein PHYPA_014916 [Physcomitrium patens]